MANKGQLLGDYEVDVRFHDDRLVIKIQTGDKEKTAQVYKDLVAKGLLKEVRLS
jgi:hypothetical protein